MLDAARCWTQLGAGRSSMVKEGNSGCACHKYRQSERGCWPIAWGQRNIVLAISMDAAEHSARHTIISMDEAEHSARHTLVSMDAAEHSARHTIISMDEAENSAPH